MPKQRGKFVLSSAEETQLHQLIRAQSTPLGLAQRARVVKLAAQAIDTVIAEVQSAHQGAFSNLWQPAIRALLLPSSGIGLATLLQYLPH